MTPEEVPVDPIPSTAAPVELPSVAPDDASPKRVPSLREQLRVCTHNPLYVVSSALVVYGLLKSFPVGSGSPEWPLLAICLAAYVLLLATTAWLLRRLGVLWEDLRMLGLLAVLLLPMVSVGFDFSLQAKPEVGRLWACGGALFAALVGEGLVTGLRMRLPWGYRLPYHLLMTLFFVWPTVVQPLSATPQDPTLQWLLFGFAAAAGAILLMLLPAVWLGPKYVAHNGTPWSWPWYPTVIFVPLIICASGRAYYLCEAFHTAARGQTIFAPYFLVPLAWAAGILFLVGGKRHRRTLGIGIGLVLPAVAVLLSTMNLGKSTAATEFLTLFRGGLGAMPPLVVTAGTCAIYAGAWLGKVPGARKCLMVSLVALGFVDRDSLRFLTWTAGPNGWPVLIASVLLTVRAALRRAPLSATLGAACLWLAVEFFGARRDDLPIHFLSFYTALALCVAQAWWIAGERALLLRAVVTLQLLAALVDWRDFGLYGLRENLSEWWQLYYPEWLVLCSGAAALVLRDRMVTLAASLVALNYLVYYGEPLYRKVKLLVPGIDALVAGLGMFVAAVWLSLARRRKSHGPASVAPPPPATS
ncbi:MAG: hypothetical protein JNK76_16265 [Planctomycetales bacterium]|nr:hypothetical protein [Planctomycetales bacterium]MBN8626872.1 hypothetical protein [Planctomycetota bacterium]